MQSAQFGVISVLIGALLAGVGLSPAHASADVAQTIATQTTAAPAANVERVSGRDRYTSAVAMSRAAFPENSGIVWVASGANYPDGLSAASAAIKQNAPLLLTHPRALPDAVRDEIIRLAPSTVVVAGGSASVSETVVASLREIAPKVIRVAGQDRFATSQAIAEYAFSGGADTVYLSNGMNFPDALSAGSAAGTSDAPLILVNGAARAADSATMSVISRLGATKAKIAGGPASVSEGIADSLSGLGAVTRLGGSDRFGSSVSINADRYARSAIVYLANGFLFPDALAGSAIAGGTNAPLFVAPSSCVPVSVKAQIERLGATTVVLLGGPASLDASVKALVPCHPSIGDAPATPITTPVSPAPNHGVYASSAISATNALANPVEFELPAAALVDGHNVITAEVHSDYRLTPSHSFELTAAAGTTLVPAASSWRYWYKTAAPTSDWIEPGFDDSSWSTGTAPLGYGHSSLGTALTPLATRPLTSYYRKMITVADAGGLPAVQISTRADDGIIVYVNGREVLRRNMPGTTVPAPTPIPAPAPAAGAWKLAWSDEFDGATVDSTKWNVLNNSTYGDGNLELACLMNRPENVKVSDGVLTIAAQRESGLRCGRNDSRFPEGRPFSSAHLETRGKASFEYGRFEIRAQTPNEFGKSKGLWPAFWLRPERGGIGELDIMEIVGTAATERDTSNSTSQTIWYDYNKTYPHQAYVYRSPVSFADGWHTHAVEWEPGAIRWYVDGVLTRTRDTTTTPWIDEAFSSPFFIRLNMAIGGRWPGTPDANTNFDDKFLVDYIRVYQRGE